MNVLITGGAGFIGSHLADSLLAMGSKVTILDNFDPFYPREIKERNIEAALATGKVSLVEGDIRIKEDIDAIFKNRDIDLVVHLAAKAGVRPSIEHTRDYYDVNITGTLNILESMKEYGIKKMIFASSSSVYGNNEKVPFSESDFVDNPISPYAATKKSGELLCHVFAHLHDFDITCLRFFTVFGPRQRPDLAIHKFAKLISDNKSIPFFGDGTTARDYTYVDDIVHGINKAIETLDGYKVYNLGESNTITLRELVNLLGEVLGKEVLINALPKQDGDVEITYADISKAKNEIGYNPQVNINEGLVSFISWLKKNQK